jgi:hypothetical protein
MCRAKPNLCPGAGAYVPFGERPQSPNQRRTEREHGTSSDCGSNPRRSTPVRWQDMLAAANRSTARAHEATNRCMKVRARLRTRLRSGSSSERLAKPRLGGRRVARFERCCGETEARVPLNDKIHGRRGCPARRSRWGARPATHHCSCPVDRLRALHEPRQRPCQTTTPGTRNNTQATVMATRSRSCCSYLTWAPDGGAGFVVSRVVRCRARLLGAG